MLQLSLGLIGILMGFFGVLTNIYVLLVLLLSKKARSSSEWILLHLSSCGLATSVLNLCFSSPSIILNDLFTSSKYGMKSCEYVGATTLALQLLTVWSICALSVDRCAAIVSPLRYTQVVTRRRIAVYFIVTWIVSAATVFAALCLSSLQEGILDQNSLFQPMTTIPSVEFGTFSTEFTPSHIEIDGEESGLGVAYLHSPWNETLHNKSRTELEGTPHVSDSGTPITKMNTTTALPFKFRPLLGLCIPKVYHLTWGNIVWTTEWLTFTLVAPMCTFLICDLTVLSIARRQRHRIVMALYQITLSAQATVTRSKGDPPNLWFNRTVPAKSRACRAVFEDITSILILHLPLVLILVLETIDVNRQDAPDVIVIIGSVSLFVMPSINALLYGVRARPLRTAYKSYLRKRLTNSTLQHEIQQRLSPVDGSPRPSSRAKSFRSSSPNSPTWSPIPTPARRLSGNDLRPPPMHLALRLSPSHDHIGRNIPAHKSNGSSSSGMKARKVRSFLHIPSQNDMQELWSGLRKPNRSPTIVITHEIRIKDSATSLFTPNSSPPNAEHML